MTLPSPAPSVLAAGAGLLRDLLRARSFEDFGDPLALSLDQAALRRAHRRQEGWGAPTGAPSPSRPTARGRLRSGWFAHP